MSSLEKIKIKLVYPLLLNGFFIFTATSLKKRINMLESINLTKIIIITSI